MDERLTREDIDKAPAVELTPDQALCPSYEASHAGIIWHRPTKDAVVTTMLTNFTARIVADVVIDDGLETSRTFVIEAKLGNRTTRFELAAAKFAAMNWHAEYLGAGAIIYPGLVIRDHARAAIQLLSAEAGIDEHIVYAHLGWRKHNDQWVYLHADGAIGEPGAIDAIAVQVESNLSRYRLPEPPIGQDCTDAIQRSMRLLDVAPAAITLPLYGAIWRSVLGESDLSIHLSGPTGQGKTAFAALVQQHFGDTMEARYLPANWTSSANALEALAFAAKDAILTVDEYTPIDSKHAQQLQLAAERIFRSQANGSGRQRMRADTSLRPPKPPRGLIVSTGEDIPKGQSLQARMLLIDVAPNSVDFEKLTACQQDALDGYYARALAAFIQWLASKYAEIQAHWRTELAELRQAAAQDGQHRRNPGNMASLALGWRYFLTFAWQTNALSKEEAEVWWRRSWDTLRHIAAVQDQSQKEAEPTQRFLDLLQDAIASGRAHLKKLGGYDEVSYQGERIGWIDGDRVYLLPDVAYAVAQRLGNDAGNGLTVAPSTLRKRLKEKGLLAEMEANRTTLLVRKQIEGGHYRVLVIFSRILSGGKKHAKYDNSTSNPPELSCFYPPLVTQLSCFSAQYDNYNQLNNEDLKDSWHICHVFTEDRGLEVKNTPESCHIGPRSPDRPLSSHETPEKLVAHPHRG
jgi:hypothetical protein